MPGIELKDHRFHILIIASWYPNPVQPLSGTFVRNHAEAISKFCKVTVLHVYSDVSLTNEEFKTEINHANPDLTEVVVSYPKITSSAPGFSHWKKFRTIKQVLKKVLFQHKNLFETVNGLHFHVMLPMILFRKSIQNNLKKIRRTNPDEVLPLFITEHSTKFTSLRKEGFNRIEHGTILSNLKKAESVTAVSAMLQHSIEELYPPANFDIIPNVVDTNIFVPTEREPIRSEDEKIIVHISDLKDVHKNIRGLILAAASLKTSRSDFRVNIIGGGEERKELEAYARELNVLDQEVFFLGELTDSDLVQNIQKATCLSLFSNFETFGVVLIEALACGIPVVASAHECVKEFVKEPEHGHLILAGDQISYEKALTKVLDQPNQFDRNRMHNYIKERYSYESVGRRFLELYKKHIPERFRN